MESTIKEMQRIENIPEFNDLNDGDKCQVRHIVDACLKTGPEFLDKSEKKLIVRVNISPTVAAMDFITKHFMDRSKWQRVTHGRSGSGTNFVFFYQK